MIAWRESAAFLGMHKGIVNGRHLFTVLERIHGFELDDGKSFPTLAAAQKRASRVLAKLTADKATASV